MVYRAHLTQHEADQLFLADEGSVSMAHVENDEVLRHLAALRPACRALGALATLTSLLVFSVWFAHVIVTGHMGPL